MAIIVTKWFGVFLVDERTGRVIDSRLMSKNVEECARKLALIQKCEILPEERELAGRMDRVYVGDRRQSELGKPKMYDSSFIKAEDYGFDKNFMHAAMIRLGELRTSEPIARDVNLVQAIRALDDLIQVSNLMGERLREWYGMHFPELADFAKDNRYAALVAKHGERDGILRELGLEIESVGADFDSADLGSVQSLAGSLDGIYAERLALENYVNEVVLEVCPNMCAVLGGPISARLISLAGGLTRLASLPSSTVQLLGAEKAMFRHLRSKKPSPKHGVIYQYPAVRNAPYWQRGKISRALAGKVLIAAKIDAYGGEFRGDRLSEELDARIKDIKRRYPDPPAKPAKNAGRHGSKRRKKHRPTA